MFRSKYVVLNFALFWGLACGGVAPKPTGSETCNNKIDDNGDGKVDCSDPKCFESPNCQGNVELCDNDVDDNANGTVDCLDSLCANQSCGPDCLCVGGLKVRTNRDGGAGGGGGGQTGGGDGQTGGGGDGQTGGGVGDQTPNAFAFSDVLGATPSTLITSLAVPVTGFDGPLTLTCAGCSAVGRNGTFGGTSVTGVMPGDTIAARALSAAAGGVVNVTVTLGGTSAGWSITSRVDGYDWDVGVWTACSNLCGAGSRTRSVSCTAADGSPAADSQCTSPKPAESQSCTGSTGCSSCSLPWGGTLSHGNDVTAYSALLPPGPCVSQVRTCTNGVLSGSYSNRTCSAGCTLPWNSSLTRTSGQIIKAYRIQFGDVNGTAPKFCESTSTTNPDANAFIDRTCTNGVWSGNTAYRYESCKNYPCEREGAYFADDALSFSTPTRIRDPNGLVCYGPTKSWMTASIYWGPEANHCLWGTRYYNPGTCGYQSSKAYTCTAGNWQLSTTCGQSP